MEPLDEPVFEAIKTGEIPTGDIKKSRDVARKLMDLGWDRPVARGVLSIEKIGRAHV